MFYKYHKPTINCCSWADRFNSTWTFLFLLVLASIAGIRHYLGPNATCWSPSHFTQQMNTYCNDVCWMAREITDRDGYTTVRPYSGDEEYDSLESSRTLYQWLPAILLFQALFFRLPDILLRLLDSAFGFDSTKVVTMVQGYNTLTSSDRMTLAQNVSNYANQTFNSRFFKFMPFGVVTIVLAFTKLLFFINAVTQLSVLEGYLSPPNISSYGEYVMDSIISDNATDIATSPAFPRFVSCSFDMRMLQNIQRLMVTCAIPVNDFNDKLCFVVWIWLLVVCLITGTSGVVFLVKNILPIFRNRFVSKYLQMGKINPTSSQLISFAGGAIGQDGIFLLGMISEVSSDILVRDIVFNLWYMNEGQTPDAMAYSMSQSSAHDDGGQRINPGSTAVDAPTQETIEMEKPLMKRI